jgi:hypothetical protein
MYKLLKDMFGEISNCVCRKLDGAIIPLDPANSDFVQFKKDLANGAELQDADGTVIDGIAYLEELA